MCGHSSHTWNRLVDVCFFSAHLGCIILIDTHKSLDDLTDRYLIVYGMMRSIYAMNSLIFNFRLRFKWMNPLEMLPLVIASLSLFCIELQLPQTKRYHSIAPNNYKFQNEIRNVIKCAQTSIYLASL